MARTAIVYRFGVELTRSYERVFPAGTLARYDLRETRNAAAIVASSNPAVWADVLAVLDEFRLEAADITEPGGNKSRVASRLDEAFRLKGWREARYDTRIVSVLRIFPYRAAGERAAVERVFDVLNEGYKVDNVKDRIALDVEWNAKDGNLDRDVGAYRALYDAAIIDAAVIVTPGSTPPCSSATYPLRPASPACAPARSGKKATMSATARIMRFMGYSST